MACNPVYNRLIWGYSISKFVSLAYNAFRTSGCSHVLDDINRLLFGLRNVLTNDGKIYFTTFVPSNRVADSALAAGGRVLGVTIQALKEKDEFHQGLTELHVLPTMHERKNLMVQLADGFVAMPGGIGTLEEFF